MVWEVGTEGCEVRSLRSRLGLDSGHASRLLRTLEADGLVELEPSPADRRVRVARLTSRGLAERALLDERSDEVANSILAPLGPGGRSELVGAMRTVERLLMKGTVELRAVDPAGRDAQRCIRAYFAEIDRRSDSGFDPDTSLPAEPQDFVAPAGAFLVAYLQGEPVGCGGVRHSRAASRRSSGCGSPSRCAGWAPAGACSRSWRRCPPPRLLGGAPGHQPLPRRGHLHVPVGGLCRGAGVQRRAVRPPLVPEGTLRESSRPWTSSSS